MGGQQGPSGQPEREVPQLLVQGQQIAAQFLAASPEVRLALRQQPPQGSRHRLRLADGQQRVEPGVEINVAVAVGPVRAVAVRDDLGKHQPLVLEARGRVHLRRQRQRSGIHPFLEVRPVQQDQIGLLILADHVPAWPPKDRVLVGRRGEDDLRPIARQPLCKVEKRVTRRADSRAARGCGHRRLHARPATRQRQRQEAR